MDVAFVITAEKRKSAYFLLSTRSLLETTHPGFLNLFYSFLTCGTDGIKKTVIVIGANKSARKYDSVEGNVILCHELMKSDLEHTIQLSSLCCAWNFKINES